MSSGRQYCLNKKSKRDVMIDKRFEGLLGLGVRKWKEGW